MKLSLNAALQTFLRLLTTHTTVAMILPVVCPKQPPEFSMHAFWLLEINFHFLGLLLQCHPRKNQYTYAYHVVCGNDNDTHSAELLLVSTIMYDSTLSYKSAYNA